MLLPYTTLTYFGPGAASMSLEDGIGVGTAQISARRNIRAAVTADGVGDAPTLRPFRGRAFGLTADGTSSVQIQPRKRVRGGLRVTVSALSQDDVTGALLEAPIEGSLTLKQAIRLLLAKAAGDATNLNGNPAFLSMDGSKTRLAGTVSGGTRTITTRDGT